MNKILKTMRVVWDGEHVSVLQFVDTAYEALLPREVELYFNGELKEFHIPYKLVGTPFQLLVWNALLTIPYAVTLSYSDVASMIQHPKASRAVALAVSNNPLHLIVPCHRVIGKNGDLCGYRGGAWRKKWLLEHERNNKNMV